MKIKQFSVLTKDVGWHFTFNMLHSVFIFLNNGKNAEYEEPSCSCWLRACLAFFGFQSNIWHQFSLLLYCYFKSGHNPIYVVQKYISKFCKTMSLFSKWRFTNTLFLLEIIMVQKNKQSFKSDNCIWVLAS